MITDARVAELERRIKSRRARPDTERRLALQVIERLRITDLALDDAIRERAQWLDIIADCTGDELVSDVLAVNRLSFLNRAINKLKDERTPHADPR